MNTQLAYILKHKRPENKDEKEEEDTYLISTFCMCVCVCVLLSSTVRVTYNITFTTI